MLITTTIAAASSKAQIIAIEYGSKADGHGAILLDGLDPRNTTSAVAVTADGAVWFRESFTWRPRVARYAASGNFYEFFDPMFDTRPGNLLPDTYYGNAFAADGNSVVVGDIEREKDGSRPRIRRMNADGSTEWKNADGCITAGSDFACWASHRGDPRTLLRDNRAPNSVVRGPRGELWLTDCYQGSIIRLAPDGTRTVFRKGLTRYDSGPQFITVGPDGNLWFTEIRDRVGRITEDGRIIEFSTGIPKRASLGGIIAGRDGNLYFTLFHGMVLGKITINGKVTLYHDLVYPSDGHDYNPVAMLARDSEGRLYENESQAGRVARFTIPK